MLMKAKMKDGRDVIVVHENKGDVVPAFNDKAQPYAAYTSMIEVRDLAGERLGLVFSQVDKEVADSGDVVALRSAADEMAIESLGVDLETLKDAA
jgi:hypothetical protein